MSRDGVLLETIRKNKESQINKTIRTHDAKVIRESRQTELPEIIAKLYDLYEKKGAH